MIASIMLHSEAMWRKVLKVLGSFQLLRLISPARSSLFNSSNLPAFNSNSGSIILCVVRKLFFSKLYIFDTKKNPCRFNEIYSETIQTCKDAGIDARAYT